MKTCFSCKEDYPFDSYYNDKQKKDGKTPYCVKCRKIKAKKQNDKDPTKARDRANARRNENKLAFDLNRMGLTEDQYLDMLEKQNGACAICKKPETYLTVSGGVPRRLSVDHDHACCNKKRDLCGKCNRDLLCTRCNQTIGKAEENIELLEAMIGYLKKWQ